MAPQNGNRHTLCFLEHGRKQIRRLDRLPAGAAGVMQSELEDELRRRRNAKVAPSERRHQVQMFFDRLKNGVRVQLDVAHDLREHVPFNLSERQKNMFVREQRMLPAASLLDRAIDDALGRFTNLARRDVEIFYVHSLPPSSGNGGSNRYAKRKMWPGGHNVAI